MTQDQLLAAPGKILHFPTVLGSVVPDLQIPGRAGRPEVHRTGAGQHLPGQDHEVERSAADGVEPRREPAGDRHYRRAPVRRVRHDLRLGRLSWRSVAGVEEARRRGDVGQLAGWRRRQGERRRRGAGQPDARIDRLRRAGLRGAEQDHVRRRAEHGRQLRPVLSRRGDRGGGRGGGPDAGRLPRLDHERAGRRTPTPSPPSPGSCSTRIRRTRRTRR